jgi:hypothetical protein
MNAIRPFAALILLLAATPLRAADPAPALPPADDLVKLARVISLQDKTLRSFQVSGALNAGPAGLRFTVAGRQPGDLTLRLDDARDGTPVLIAAGGSVMMYDPVAAEILVFKTETEFILRMEPPPANAPANAKEAPAHTLNFGFFVHSPGSEETMTTVIDLPSMFDAVKKPLEVVADGPGAFRLEGRSSMGNRLSARVEPGREAGACARLALFDRNGAPEQPVLELSDIRLDMDLPDALFRLTDEQISASGLPVRRMEGAGMLKQLASVGMLVRAVMFRVALAGGANEEMKTKLAATAGGKLDWEALERSDRTAGKALRAAFPETSVQMPSP